MRRLKQPRRPGRNNKAQQPPPVNDISAAVGLNTTPPRYPPGKPVRAKLDEKCFIHNTDKQVYFQHGRKIGLSIFCVLQHLKYKLRTKKNLQRNPSGFQRATWCWWFPPHGPPVERQREEQLRPKVLTHYLKVAGGNHSRGTDGPFWQNAPLAASFCTCQQLRKAHRSWIGEPRSIAHKKRQSWELSWQTLSNIWRVQTFKNLNLA